MTTERKPVVTVTRDDSGISILVNGAGRPPIAVRWSALSDAVRKAAFGYGMEVRLTRAAAMTRDTKSGKAASPLDKYDAIKRLADHYSSGTDSWTMASSGGGGGLSADTRALIEALVAALGLDADVAEEQVRGMTTAERDALRVDAEIKPYLDLIYEERAKAAGAATGDLKAKLKGLSAKV